MGCEEEGSLHVREYVLKEKEEVGGGIREKTTIVEKELRECEKEREGV